MLIWYLFGVAQSFLFDICIYKYEMIYIIYLLFIESITSYVAHILLFIATVSMIISAKKKRCRSVTLWPVWLWGPARHGSRSTACDFDAGKSSPNSRQPRQVSKPQACHTSCIAKVFNISNLQLKPAISRLFGSWILEGLSCQLKTFLPCRALWSIPHVTSVEGFRASQPQPGEQDHKFTSRGF